MQLNMREIKASEEVPPTCSPEVQEPSLVVDLAKPFARRDPVLIVTNPFREYNMRFMATLKYM